MLALANNFELFIECPVGRDFAWQFRSAVENRAVVDPAVESVMLNGPIAADAGVRQLTESCH